MAVWTDLVCKRPVGCCLRTKSVHPCSEGGRGGGSRGPKKAPKVPERAQQGSERAQKESERAWPGLGMAWPGTGMAWPGLGMAWPGLGMAWPGGVWRGLGWVNDPMHLPL